MGDLTQIFLCRRGDQLGREQNVLRAEAGGSGEERKEDLPGEVLLLPPPLLLSLENLRELKTLPSLCKTCSSRCRLGFRECLTRLSAESTRWAPASMTWKSPSLIS